MQQKRTPMHIEPKHAAYIGLVWVAAAAPLVSCGTGPDLERLPGGLYHTEYDPPLMTNSTNTCDRMVSRVLLVVSERGTFELSINVIDDCSRGGDGFTFEVYRNGGYFRNGDALVFAPNTSAPRFPGTLDGEYIELILPPALELAPLALSLRIGPRAPLLGLQLAGVAGADARAVRPSS
jgi:hypothetical protein